MKILVLGAGVIGVTSAWYLTKSGHEVTVLDRRNRVAMETSFANGGQISVAQAEPWANPEAIIKILRWLGRENAPLLFRFRWDFKQWLWGLKFLYECLPTRTSRNTSDTLALAIYSRKKIQELRDSIDISYHNLAKGILTIHTDQNEFLAAQKREKKLRDFGLDVSIVSKMEMLNIEPALRESNLEIIGGSYAKDDESGDVHVFSTKLAELGKKEGVKYGLGVELTKILMDGSRVVGVVGKIGEREEVLSADAYVVALGSHSPTLLSPIDVHVPIYPVKGYSVTIPIKNKDAAPQVSLTDENAKLAFSRFGDYLRVAGSAELTGYDDKIFYKRCEMILDRTKEHFPEMGGFDLARRWTGLRPAVPSNVPLIGSTKYENLFLNTGHGTLGWTLACGSGVALTRCINQEKQEIDFPFLSSHSG